MGEFHQHPDNWVYVRSNGTQYGDRPENFERDFGSPVPSMPEGATEQIYTQGVRHCFMGNGTIIDGGPMPDPWADGIISRMQEGLTAQANRKAIGVSTLDMGQSTKMVIGV